MNDEKTQELLLKLLEDVGVIKAKLDTIEEIKIDAKMSNARIEKLEMITERQEKQIRSLENRNSAMEEFTRNNLSESKKTQTGVFISLGLAIFSSVISFVFNLL